MPLPKIVTPRYELELPSTGETILYRPFLVKEEKILVIALESKDQKQITNAIKTVIQSCIFTKSIKVENLPTFDIEYLFLNIRGKSVGEEVEVSVICQDDGTTQVSTTINLDDIKVIRDEKHTNKIKLDESLVMEMKYPSLKQFIDDNFTLDDDTSDQSFELVASCINKVFSEDEVWAAEDCTDKEMMEFVEQMSSSQFKDIKNFFDTMPKLSHTIKVKNPNTKKVNEITLTGLSDFFA